MKIYLDPRKKLYLTLVLVIGGNLIFGGVVILVMPQEISKSATEYLTAKEELNRAILERSQFAEIKKSFSEEREAVERARATLLDPKNDIEFIRLLEQTAKRTGLKAALSPLNTASAPGTGFSAYSSNLVLEGTYVNTIRFLALLEHVKFYVDIAQVSIQKTGVIPSSGEGSQPESLVRTSVSFYVYSL